MTRLFAKLGAVALIAAACLSTTVSTASARDWRPGPGPGFEVEIGGPGYHPGRPPRPRACAPGHAIEKARWNGLRRAHIDRVSQRRIVVSGFRHHRPDRMVFANVPGCPLIRR